MTTHRIQLARITSALAFLVAIFCVLNQDLHGQATPGPSQPFIGFRPFGDSTPAAATNTASRNVAFQPEARSNAPTGLPSRPSVTANTRIAYPYPAGPNVGSVGTTAVAAPERATLNSHLSDSRIPTGSLNRSLGQATMPLVANDPALARRYQLELQQSQLQQRQLQQLQYQQYQLWLQQRQLQQQRVARQNIPSNQQPTLANRPAQSQVPTRDQPTSINFRTAPKLNQAVVQQVSSTATSNRDSRVSVARFDSQQPSASDRTTTARATSDIGSPANTNTVAKPQCCVPTNCCPPANSAQALRFQAANQIPSLTTGAGQAGSYGFLGQNGAGYQAQAQSGYQFQPGLGVPQFASTGAYGNGGWFSNLVRGTGAYRPLIPLEPQYPNARPGRGIIGQPTAYVDGQPIRNLLRYVMP